MQTARMRVGEGNSGLAFGEKSREKRGLVDYIRVGARGKGANAECQR